MIATKALTVILISGIMILSYVERRKTGRRCQL